MSGGGGGGGGEEGEGKLPSVDHGRCTDKGRDKKDQQRITRTLNLIYIRSSVINL